MKSKNKKKYLMLNAIGIIFIIIPAAVYNFVNYKVFQRMSDMALVCTAMMGAAAVSLAVFRKNKPKADIYILLIGAVVLVLKEAVTQIGITLMFIGIGIFVHRLIFEKIAMIYKVRWYEESGRKVVYARSI